MTDGPDISQRLAAVQDSLLALADDAFADKYELLKQQDVLREEAARFAAGQDDERSDQELLSELSGMRSQLAHLEKQKIDLVTQAGGGAMGINNMGNLGGTSINIGMMEATGGNRIQARIGVIKGVLVDRGVEIPENPA